MRELVARPIDAAGVEAAYADLAGRRARSRPWVAVNMVASADGAISLDGRTEGLSTEADRQVFHHLRSLTDVIMVGAQTVRAERYGPPRMTEARRQERLDRGQAPFPRIAVVSGRLDLDWSSRFFVESPVRPLLVAPAGADPGRLREAERVADVIKAGDTGVDLAAALGALHALGTEVVLCEGGPTLNGQLAALDLVDELCLTVAAKLVGGDVAAGLLGRTHLPSLLPMTLVHVLEDEGDLYLRYRRAGR